MENIPPKGLVLIVESPDITGLPLALCHFKRLSQQGFDPVAVLNFTDETEFRNCCQQRIPTFRQVKCFQINDLQPKINEEIASNNLKKPAILIENLALYIELGQLDLAIRTIHRVAQDHPVLALVQTNFMDDVQVNRLNSMAQAMLKLRMGGLKDELDLCETTIKKKDGSVKKHLEQFEIDPQTLQMSAQKHVPSSRLQALPETPSTSTETQLPKTTFDLGLKLRAEELKQKRDTRLPYTAAQSEEGLVHLNTKRRVRAGGQIIYTPDQADDLDDSDPDDDLMI